MARFDATGNLVWVRQFGGPGFDEADGIAADKQGNVYVTGSFQGKADFGTMLLQGKSQPRHHSDPDERDWEYGDMFVAKYDSEGNPVWVRQAGESGLNVAHAICVDAGGNAYLSGVAQSERIRFGNITVGSAGEKWQHPCFLAKYDPKGNVLWAQSVAGDHEYHRYDKISLDSSSNLFVSGTFSFTQRVATVALDASAGSLFIAKYRPDGTLAWCRQGGSKIQNSCDALAVDADGRCFVAGGFDEAAKFDPAEVHAAPHPEGVSGYDAFMIGYSGEGTLVTASQILHRNANVTAMAAGAGGSVWLTGGFYLPVVFGKTTFKTKTFYRENPTVVGEAVSDTFVTRYQTKKR